MASETQPDAGDRTTLFISIVLVAMTLAVFGRVCTNEFVNYDDPQYVTDNPYIRAGLSADGIWWAFTSTEVLNWHPLTWLSLQLDRELYDDEAWGYHLTNLLLHAANVLLLFRILRQMTKQLWPSAFI